MSAGVSVDDLVLATRWQSREGLVVDGLLMQGFQFDGKRISDIDADAPEFIPAPFCSFVWEPSASVRSPPILLLIPKDDRGGAEPRCSALSKPNARNIIVACPPSVSVNRASKMEFSRRVLFRI
jgi:hypothetical protein